MRRKLTYVVSDLPKSLAMEWITLELINRYHIQFILIGKRDTPFSKFLVMNNVPFSEVSDEDFPSIIHKILRIGALLWRNRPEIVHTHLWRANLYALPVAWLLRIPVRIYTRHHAMVHYREFPKGRKWDVLCNFFSTKIVAISENIRAILVDLDKAPVRKVVIIHHGFDLSYFDNVDAGRIERIRQVWRIDRSKHPVIGVVARYMEWKGIQYIIPAFSKIREIHPNAHLVFANAGGNYATTIRTLLNSLPVGSYTEIHFEEDVAALFKVMDVYLHVPVDQQSEAFGQTYVEALASGVPSVFTLSGVATGFIVDKYNASVVPFRDTNAIADKALDMLANESYRNAIISNGKRSVQEFSIQKMGKSLSALYEG